MLKQGVHTKVVSERLGHSSVNIITGHLFAFSTGMQKAAVEALMAQGKGSENKAMAQKWHKLVDFERPKRYNL